MDPSDPNYYQYQQSQTPASYSATSTPATVHPAVYGHTLNPQDPAYYQLQQTPYGETVPQFEASMPPYQDTFGDVSSSESVPQQYSGQSYGVPLEFIPESEKQKQIEKRRESNRLAQRKFREENKKRVKHLQDQLESLKREVKGLQENMEGLRGQKDSLETQIQMLSMENDELKRRGSLESSSPISPPGPNWQSDWGTEDYAGPSTTVKRGSDSSYSGSHFSH